MEIQTKHNISPSSILSFMSEWTSSLFYNVQPQEFMKFEYCSLMQRQNRCGLVQVIGNNGFRSAVASA